MYRLVNDSMARSLGELSSHDVGDWRVWRSDVVKSTQLIYRRRQQHVLAQFDQWTSDQKQHTHVVGGACQVRVCFRPSFGRLHYVGRR